MKNSLKHSTFENASIRTILNTENKQTKLTISIHFLCTIIDCLCLHCPPIAFVHGTSRFNNNKNGKMFACNSIEKWSADHSKVIHQIKLEINFPYSILFHSIGNKISWGRQRRMQASWLLLLPRQEIVNKAKLKRLILKSTFFPPSPILWGRVARAW